MIQGELKLPFELQQEIIDFLLSLPNINDYDMRKALVSIAGLDRSLEEQVKIDTPPLHFIPTFINILQNYGSLEDNRNAFIAVLEATKQYIGKDKKEYCNRLIQKLRSTLKFQANSQPLNDMLDEFTANNLKNRIESLTIPYNLLTERLKRLRTALATETDPSVKFKLEQESLIVEKEQKQLAEKIRSINPTNLL